MAAVLRCGPAAVLSHESATAFWEIAPERSSWIELSVPPHVSRNAPGLVIHRRTLAERDVTIRMGIPVTTPVCTLIDIAAHLTKDRLEAAINEADKRDLTNPEALRAALGPLRTAGRPSVARSARQSNIHPH
jgi:hypothetical protein